MKLLLRFIQQVPLCMGYEPGLQNCFCAMSSYSGRRTMRVYRLTETGSTQEGRQSHRPYLPFPACVVPSGIFVGLCLRHLFDYYEARLSGMLTSVFCIYLWTPLEEEGVQVLCPVTANGYQ